jgi:hypothetical protein
MKALTLTNVKNMALAHRADKIASNPIQFKENMPTSYQE